MTDDNGHVLGKFLGAILRLSNEIQRQSFILLTRSAKVTNFFLFLLDPGMTDDDGHRPLGTYTSFIGLAQDMKNWIHVDCCVRSDLWEVVILANKRERKICVKLTEQCTMVRSEKKLESPRISKNLPESHRISLFIFLPSWPTRE